MVVRRACYEKEDVEEALDRTYGGEGGDVRCCGPVFVYPSSYPLQEIERATSYWGYRRESSRTSTSILPRARSGFSGVGRWHAVDWIPSWPGKGPRALKQCVREAAWSYNQGRKSFRSLTKGWYGRFIRRHPVLSTRTAQKIARVRNTVDEDSVRALFHAITKRVVELRLSAGRAFNMDETAFMPKGIDQGAHGQGVHQCLEQRDAAHFPHDCAGGGERSWCFNPATYHCSWKADLQERQGCAFH
ncbi:hypothetical protein JG687_00011981 [Phytophthora cactorum]|uniref:HTH CENPB-type domain-containing protein n=1 Tax=Phytophthora cactorum TaxID=29920 RepID=A0A8T1U5J8_9STRA|nr:hypothetical protein JG687_00011981 [Phytophthora cactorum]